MKTFRRHGVTLIELLVVISIIGIFLGMVVPAVQRAREASRRGQCSGQIKQLALALQNYHATFQRLPMHGGGTAQRGGIRTLADDACNHHRLAYTVAILPYIEEQSLWETISQPLIHSSGKVFASMGPVPWYNILSGSKPHPYLPWALDSPALRCPSDSAVGGDTGALNYAACMGDGIRQLGCALGQPQYSHAGDIAPIRYDDFTKRGMFANWHAMSFGDCIDGLSNTLLLGEIVVENGDSKVRSNVILGISRIADAPNRCARSIDPYRPQFFPLSASLEPRGRRWADAAPTFSAFNTVLPPNSPSCAEEPLNGAHPNWFGGIYSAGSQHSGGAYMALADGSVRFVTDSVNAQAVGRSTTSVYSGNTNNPAGSKSPYGIWGALGTRASSEALDAFD